MINYMYIDYICTFVILDPDGNVSMSACYDGDSLLKQASPYLFPFVLEYSLIAMATYAGIYAGLDVKVTKDLLKSVKETLTGQHDKPEDDTKEGDNEEARGLGHAHDGLASFAKAHRGLFMGVLVLAGIIISVVLFFYTLRERKEEESANMIYNVSDLTLNGLLLVAVIVGISKSCRMGLSDEKDNTIDNTLLVVSFTGLFMFDIFSVIYSICYIAFDMHTDSTIMETVAGLLSIVQGLLQTIFICDGLQRFALSKHQEREKPGRGTVTFMIIVNVGMWVFKTLQVKIITQGPQEDFYGETPWRIILNISLPLMLFFRFHSSVCLADMYEESFKPEEKPLTYSYIL